MLYAAGLALLPRQWRQEAVGKECAKARAEEFEIEERRGLVEAEEKESDGGPEGKEYSDGEEVGFEPARR
jgi:hypothetical protein